MPGDDCTEMPFSSPKTKLPRMSSTFYAQKKASVKNSPRTQKHHKKHKGLFKAQAMSAMKTYE